MSFTDLMSNIRRSFERNGDAKPWFATLRARLYLAFGFAAAMTVVGSLIALYTFDDVNSTTTEIVARSTPAMIQSLRLAEETSSLLATAPRLMAVANEAGRDGVEKE